MNMIFLLGGPPRVGKTLISGDIQQKCGLSVVSTDTLSAVLEDVLSPQVAPDLYVFARFYAMPIAEQVKYISTHPAKFLDYIRRESHVVWKAIKAFIKRESEQGRDALIEGVAVLPELVNDLEGIPHRVVFIGNQGEEHKEHIERFAAENELDWMRGASDPFIHSFAAFVKWMSEYIHHEAMKYGFEYIEMDRKSLEDVTMEVLESLGLSTNE
jgi:2-phosphoglycerate kinase